LDKEFAKKIGKSTGPIFKVKPVDFKAFSKSYGEKLERRSEKRRKEEKERKKKALQSINEDIIKNRNRLEQEQQQLMQRPSNSLIPPVRSTQTFEYTPLLNPNLPEGKPEIPIYQLDQYEQREIREQTQFLKLVKQYFEITYHDYFKYYPLPYPSSPLEISCFAQLMDNENRDMSDIAYIEADYEKCYTQKLISIKNLGRYDCWEDLPPEKWLEMCDKNDDEYDGTSPMYDYTTDKYMWNPVKVLSYNPENGRYKVRFVKTEKEVSRLSLLFKWENKDEFEYRKYLCEKRRNHVDQFILFSRYVDNVPKEIVSELCLEWEKKIERSQQYQRDLRH
jgi:hypothetical protein